MKLTDIKIKPYLQKRRKKKETMEVFKEITLLKENNLSPFEIELFLNIKLSDFNKNFFDTHFSNYAYLSDNMNVIQLISYITYLETLRKEILEDLLKKCIYPIILIFFSYLTLVIFKHSLLEVLSDFTSIFIKLVINAFYYVTKTLISLSIILSLAIVILLQKKEHHILLFNRIHHLKVFSLLELYYVKIITYLLISSYQEGLSTQETFTRIQSLKNETIISNIAYFLTTHLEEGFGLEKSIDQMKLSDKFKRVLSFAIKSENYEQLLSSYMIQIDLDIKREIKKLSRRLYAVSYIHISLLILVFYIVLSLPLSMIDMI